MFGLFGKSKRVRRRREIDMDLVRRMREEGRSLLEISVAVGVTVPTLTYKMVKAGLHTARNISALQREVVARNEEIIARREAGATYQEIADWCNLSRERVRQVLYKAGRRDLTRRLPKKQRPPKKCAHCGKDFYPPMHANKYCSTDCRNAAVRGKLRVPRERILLILREREKGATWEDAAKAIGLRDGPHAMQLVLRAASMDGWDISWVRGSNIGPQPGAVDAMLAKVKSNAS